jgi:hypothetical protein
VEGESDCHTLWMIDERLAYYQFLASDLPLKKHRGPIHVDSEDCPDLLIYNNPIAFAPGDEPYPSVVIIELERPESFDGKGVPLMKAEVVKLKAKLGTGEKRQQKKEALVGVSYTVEDKPCAPEALAELLVDPEAARARRQRDALGDDAPRAQQVRRLASLVRTKQEGLECIKADAERREPQHRKPLVILFDDALGLRRLAPKLFREWRRVTCVLDLMHVVGDLWSAANALCGEGSKDGTRRVQVKLTAILHGRVGYVIGGLRQILTKWRLRKAVREALAKVITFFQNHRR